MMFTDGSERENIVFQIEMMFTDGSERENIVL